MTFPVRSFLAAAAIAVSADPAQATITNLAQGASGAGVLPSISLDQGTAAGIFDSSMYSWYGLLGASSPRNFTATNIQPYLTWANDQTVRTVRVWFDYTNVNPFQFDRLVIDSLTGSDPTQEGSWTTRLDTGSGLAARFADLNLGSTVVTKGLRVRAFKSTADVNVGEVAVFGPDAIPNYTTLTAAKVIPTNVVASSFRFRPASQGANGDWFDGGWLADTNGANPGTDYTLDLQFGNAEINGVSVTFAPQGGYAGLPTNYSIQVQYENTSNFVNLGTFATVGSQLQYYLDFGKVSGIRTLRLDVPESQVPSNLSVAVIEFEPFFVPEPSGVMLVGLAGLMVALRRRAR